MTHEEIAQKIAENVNTHSQDEVAAMMRIVCQTTDITPAWLHKAVSNLYARLEPSVMSSGPGVGHVSHD